jgi:hypothetical protein
MIRITTVLLTASFSLIMSALTAQAANTQLATTQAAKTSTIPISYLPFDITAPGTYVLTANLISTATRLNFEGYNGAINISGALMGPVVVDLKGFTLTGPGANSIGIDIGAFSNGLTNTYPITIRNGTLTKFPNWIGRRE